MSEDWNTGYVTEVDYTFGYYGELNPLKARLPLLLSGIHAPRIQTACELGFGQGLSVAMHAVAQPGVNWWGTDFNPAQAAFAGELVGLSGARARLYDEAFADFCNRQDLPDFDFIGIHGVWSWISEENRAVLVRFIERRLKPGGVLYISYNTDPGWAATAPIRHLLKRHAEVMGTPGQGVVAQTDGALDFIGQLLALQPLYARQNPAAVERLEQIRKHDRRYVAHEYMNRDWRPMHFADVEAALGPAKVSFGASAHTLDFLHNINLTPEQGAFVAALSHASLRETVIDYCVNRQFRRDYWVRGVRRLTAPEQLAALREERVVLTVSADAVPTKVRGVAQEAALVEAVYRPVIDLLSDHKPRSVHELETHLAKAGVSFVQLHSILIILLGLGVLQAAASGQEAQRAKASAQALNKILVQRSLATQDIGHLVSPVLGGGVAASRFQQMFWAARQAGGKTPADWASSAWTVLRGQGQALIKDGVTLQGEDNLKELTSQAESWSRTQLPIWISLGL